MKLYLLSTRGLGDFYLISNDPTEAENKLTELLDKADYGFLNDRVVENIKFLTKEIDDGPKSKPNFSPKGNRLIIVEKW